jgi:hypothetical protein
MHPTAPLTFVIRKLAVFALKQEIPKPKLRNLEGRIEGFGRHVEVDLRLYR